MDFEIYKKPIEILDVVEDHFGERYAEMSHWQQGFMCGLIKKYKPRKILEIGVSAGGTTAVLMNTLELLDYEAQLFSVDCLDYYYRDTTKKAGFVATWTRDYFESKGSIKWTHKLFTGGSVCNYFDEIGKSIDFLILDAAHSCPGEILDFLACFPFLSDDAIVVMHDLVLHFDGIKGGFATQLLMDTVVADKMIGRDEKDPHHSLPNIGAFQLTPDTGKYIKNVFLSLNILWDYLPQELNNYRNVIEKNYDQDMLEIFDLAVANNKDYLQNSEELYVKEFTSFVKLVKSIGERKVYIYGNGKIGKRLDKLLRSSDVEVLGHIVSDGVRKDNDTYYLGEVHLTNDIVIVIGTNENYLVEIKSILQSRGVTNYISLG